MYTSIMSCMLFAVGVVLILYGDVGMASVSFSLVNFILISDLRER